VITGWLSVGIGIIAILIGASGYVLGRLVDSLLSDLEIGTHDEMEARGVRLVLISLPRLYVRIVLSIFGWRDRPAAIQQHAVTHFLFWSLLLPFAHISTERSDQGNMPGKGEKLALLLDAGNLSRALSVVVSLGSFLSLLFGVISVAFGILSLVAPWIIDDWIPSTASLIRENHPWLGWLVLIVLIGAIVLLTWLMTSRRHKRAESRKPSGMTRGTADAPRSESTEKTLSLAKVSVIHIDAHILGSLGKFFVTMGRYNLAIRCLEEALKGHQKVRELEGEAANLNDLGVAFYCRGELDAAFDKYRQAMEIFETLDDQRGRAGCLANIATIHLAKKDRVEAIDHYQRALLIYERLRMHKAADRVRHVISGVEGSREPDMP